ncbi:hypothetical protein BC938DRAFT_474975 [Jimgerdemannia flammicorona]|uniref:Uncharacterized protein n=1 Tax=Jimgerdemannia flammicorona TaxID=994334 RepID=A0A433QS49_9FUNG|nr:hypothetical protein BC938DRAFT_474975 [Jimgerdemannia flammicorona]
MNIPTSEGGFCGVGKYKGSIASPILDRTLNWPKSHQVARDFDDVAIPDSLRHLANSRSGNRAQPIPQLGASKEDDEFEKFAAEGALC